MHVIQKLFVLQNKNCYVIAEYGKVMWYTSKWHAMAWCCGWLNSWFFFLYQFSQHEDINIVKLNIFDIVFWLFNQRGYMIIMNDTFCKQVMYNNNDNKEYDLKS